MRERGTVINIEQELEELQNDERQLNRYIFEKYPQLSNYKLRKIERIIKTCLVFVQGVVLLINQNDNFCPINKNSDESQSQQIIIENSDIQSYFSSITKCSQEKSFILSILTGVLFLILGFWLILMKYCKQNQLFMKYGVQIFFLVLVFIVQALVFEIYLYQLVSFFWTTIQAIQLVILMVKYIKPLKIRLVGQIFSVIYIQIRFYIQYQMNNSEIFVGFLFFTLLILQNVSNQVLYRNKLQILQITRNQLNSVRQFYNDLLGLIPQGLTLLDSSQNIIYANSRVTEILQCEEKDIFSILMNLSNNNAKKASTFADCEQSQRQTKNLTASINAALVGGGGNLDTQPIHTIQSKLQMPSSLSKQINSLNPDDFKSSIKLNSNSSTIQNNQTQGQNPQTKQKNTLQISSNDTSQQQKRQEQNIFDSHLNYQGQDRSFIQTETVMSLRELNINESNSIEQSNFSKNSGNNINLSNNQKQVNKNYMPVQSKFGSSAQKVLQQAIKDDSSEHQYTLGVGDNNFSQKDYVIQQKNKKERQQSQKDIMICNAFDNISEIDMNQNTNTVSPSKSFGQLSQLRLNTQISSPNKTKKGQQNIYKQENFEYSTLTQSGKSPILEDEGKDTKKSKNNTSFFGEYANSSHIQNNRRESMLMFSNSDNEQQQASMNLNTDHILGDKSMNCDISTFPFQSTDRRGILIYGDEGDDNLIKEKTFNDYLDSPMKQYSETTRGNLSKTDLILKNASSEEQSQFNQLRRLHSDCKSAINEIQQINSNGTLKLKNSASLIVYQQGVSQERISKDGPKEFSFGQNILATFSTNHQIHSPKKNQITFQNIGFQSNAAFQSSAAFQSTGLILKREDRASIDDGQQIANSSIQQFKSNEMINSKFNHQKSGSITNESNIELGKLDKLIQKSNQEIIKNQSFCFENNTQGQTLRQIHQIVEVDCSEEEKKTQNQFSNLSILNCDLDFTQQIQDSKKYNQDSILNNHDLCQQNSELSLQNMNKIQFSQEFKAIKNKNKFDIFNNHLNLDEKDKCMTECRKSILEKSLTKRNSRLDKNIKTLEVQDLPKYQEEKNMSVFKQQEDSKKQKEKLISSIQLTQSQNSNKKNNSNRLIPEKTDSKKIKKISSEMQALMQSPSSLKFKKEKQENSSFTKINSQNNILSTPKTPLDSRLSLLNRPKAENQFNPIETESMSLKKYVISQKESKDIAYKSLFQPKIIKKETKVKNILTKLLTLNKQEHTEDNDSKSEISRTKQFTQIDSNIQETQSRNEERQKVIQIPENDDGADIRSCMTPFKPQQSQSANLPQITRSKTDYFLKYKDDTQSINSQKGGNIMIQNLDMINNFSNENSQDNQNQNKGYLNPSKYKKQSKQYQKERSPTVGYFKENKSFSSPFNKFTNQKLQSFKSNNMKNESDMADSNNFQNRNRGRKESFFNQFNKEANIGKQNLIKLIIFNKKYNIYFSIYISFIIICAQNQVNQQEFVQNLNLFI